MHCKASVLNILTQNKTLRHNTVSSLEKDRFVNRETLFFPTENIGFRINTSKKRGMKSICHKRFKHINC